MELAHDPTVPPLVTYPEELKTGAQTDVHEQGNSESAKVKTARCLSTV